MLGKICIIGGFMLTGQCECSSLLLVREVDLLLMRRANVSLVSRYVSYGQKPSDAQDENA